MAKKDSAEKAVRDIRRRTRRRFSAEEKIRVASTERVDHTALKGHPGLQPHQSIKRLDDLFSSVLHHTLIELFNLTPLLWLYRGCTTAPTADAAIFSDARTAWHPSCFPGAPGRNRTPDPLLRRRSEDD